MAAVYIWRSVSHWEKRDGTTFLLVPPRATRSRLASSLSDALGTIARASRARFPLLVSFASTSCVRSFLSFPFFFRVTMGRSFSSSVRFSAAKPPTNSSAHTLPGWYLLPFLPFYLLSGVTTGFRQRFCDFFLLLRFSRFFFRFFIFLGFY